MSTDLSQSLPQTAPSPTPDPADIQRILLINFGGIGDEILFFPVIETLRYAYPHAYLSILVEPRCHNLMDHHYFIDEVLTFDIKHRKSPGDLLDLLTLIRSNEADMIISSGGSSLVAPLLFLSGASHRVGYDSGRFPGLLTHRAPLNKEQYAANMYHDLLSPLGLARPNVVPQTSLPTIVKHWSHQWLSTQGLTTGDHIKDYVLIHPGVSLMSKEKQLIKSWERDRWCQLIQRLLKEETPVVLAGGPDDAEEVNYITTRIQHPLFKVAYGHTRDLYQLGGLIEAAGVTVCVDSAPMHLAIALQSPLVAIFGPTDENKLVPKDARYQVVKHDVHCRPCLWATRNTTCATLDCLTGIQVKQVYAAVRGFLPLAAPNKGSGHSSSKVVEV
jgi:ADP-heptose:LPS heptosyltransferase